MNKTARWLLYVSAYTALLGVPLLFLPRRISLIHYAPHEEPWLRITGMCFLAFSYFNFVAFRERSLAMIQTLIICKLAFFIYVVILLLLGHTRLLYLVAGMLLVGIIGPFLTYCRERREYDLDVRDKLPKTSRWNLYVASYTAVFGFGAAL
jgi:fatty acid desaturase